MNINEEINKKKEIEDPKYEKENLINEEKYNSDNDYKIYLNTGPNSYSRNNNNSLINNNDIFNNSATERKIDRISNYNKKEPIKAYNDQVIQPIHHMRKVPSLNFLPNNKNNYYLGYRKRYIESSNK